jgi:hypothetical protein
MVIATLILVISLGFLVFYLQMVCRRILQGEFEQEYYRLVVSANRMEFPFVRRSIVEIGSPVDYPRVRTMLKRDFLALSYLLKYAGENSKARSPHAEKLLLVYFRFLLLALAWRHFLTLRMEPAVLKLTEVLQYLSNIVGERVGGDRFGTWAASKSLTNG